MNELEIHEHLVNGVFLSAGIAFLLLLFISAPYGRHLRAGWGPTIPNRLGWIIMESPAVILFLVVFLRGEHQTETVPLVLCVLWQLHYVHRTFIFPFRIRSQGKRMPLLIMSLALIFNCVNAYINARWLSHFGDYSEAASTDPVFLVGCTLFLLGFMINLHSDTVLINLRKPGETGYKIPQGGAYRWLTSPNYFGELLAWTGWAIAAQSTSAVAFTVFTAANLVPRAISNHRWYTETFPDYPEERRRIIPFLF
jgi:protein-S-isoprenylcysteine O-methyltransferase Ste14